MWGGGVSVRCEISTLRPIFTNLVQFTLDSSLDDIFEIKETKTNKNKRLLEYAWAADVRMRVCVNPSAANFCSFFDSKACLLFRLILLFYALIIKNNALKIYICFADNEMGLKGVAVGLSMQ